MWARLWYVPPFIIVYWKWNSISHQLIYSTRSRHIQSLSLVLVWQTFAIIKLFFPIMNSMEKCLWNGLLPRVQSPPQNIVPFSSRSKFTLDKIEFLYYSQSNVSFILTGTTLGTYKVQQIRNRGIKYRIPPLSSNVLYWTRWHFVT